MGIAVILWALLACGRAGSGGAPPDSDTVLSQGDSLYARGEFDSARTAWRSMLTRPGVAGTASEARLLTWLGLAAMRLGEFPESRRLGEQGLLLARRQATTVDVAQALNALALLAWQEGRLADAAALADSALAGYRGLGDAAGTAKASNTLGLAQFDLGRFDEARESFLATRDAGRTLGNLRYEARALTNLAMWEISAGEPARAFDHLTQARPLIDSAADALGLAASLGQTASAYSLIGQPGLALAAVDSALAVARRYGMREEEAGDLLLAARIHAEAGDPERALEAFAQARQINRELGLLIEAGAVFRDEAILRAGRGAHDRARSDGLEALRLHQEAGSRHEEFLDLLALADIERQSGRFGEAERRVDEARRLSGSFGSSQARLALALCEARIADAQGQADRTVRVLAGAAGDLRMAGPESQSEWSALRLRAFAATGQLDSSVAAGRLAIAAIEQVRSGFASGPLRMSYVAGRSRVYADLVLALLRQGRSEEAFAVADAARGRALLEQLSSAREARAAGAAADLAESERLLRQIDHLLARLARESARPDGERGIGHSVISEELLGHLDRARSAYQSHLIRAAERDPVRARMLGANPATGREIRETLQSDELLVEYLVTESHLFVFVVSRDSTRVATRAIRQEQVIHQVQLARELLVSLEARGRDQAVTEALHDLLVKPVQEHPAFASARHLIVVPHAVLSYLPFAALRDRVTGHTLIQDVAISYLPSAAVLPLLRSREHRGLAARGAAGFAPFPEQLPSTDQEVRAFGEAVPRAVIRLGERATEAAVRRALSTGSLVHLATHGVLSARAPLFSRIELARGRGTPRDDGRLEVHELLDFTVSSPLVFLSGCQTGLGSTWITAFDQGEDFATLAQAFLYAGAGAVIATLWRIDDAGAAAFAERFYHHLRSRSAPQALALAQQDLRRDQRWQSPYYWAGYALSGAVSPSATQVDGSVAVQTQSTPDR